VQILFTELILTAALFYGIWLAGNDNPGRLGAVIFRLIDHLFSNEEGGFTSWQLTLCTSV
jgi:hypothetical protein